MAHKRQRKRTVIGDGDLSMTPMIDIVFQLLIYFLVTFEPVDVMAHLDVYRPAPEQERREQMEMPNVLQITIYEDGYTMNERRVDLAGIERMMARLASIDERQTVLIMVTADSRHESLVDVLDVCAKTGMRNLSVVSMN